MVKTRKSSWPNAIELYSIAGSWFIKLVVLVNGTPVDEVLTFDVARNDYTIEVRNGTQQLRSAGRALEVYQCILSGAQAISLQ
jgi:hypothetical protein